VKFIATASTAQSSGAVRKLTSDSWWRLAWVWPPLGAAGRRRNLPWRRRPRRKFTSMDGKIRSADRGRSNGRS